MAAQRISAYFNNLRALKGRFIQIAPSGRQTSGTLYLRLPGRARFVYDPPSSLLIVVGSGLIAIREAADAPFHRIPLRGTPLRFLLDDTLDLTDTAGVVARGGRIRATEVAATFVRAKDPDAGSLELRLAGAPLALVGWQAVDPQGLTTEVRIADLEEVDRLDPRLFITRDPEAQRRRESFGP